MVGESTRALRPTTVCTDLGNPVGDWHHTEGEWAVVSLAKATRSIVNFNTSKVDQHAFDAFDTLIQLLVKMAQKIPLLSMLAIVSHRVDVKPFVTLGLTDGTPRFRGEG
ncbi:uncharacterized protein N7506_012190 [Penicillium brevicompactum]|uniref:uncharacterized protein n=1 Tax=Penicillium brevicompactum TaxID=5074 RepID=UPI0025407066|nr:uncharacterized protein N7506_012190 [Penicillium brevicompactum]KAJ5319486.1 hypothetical protein N7506_012190 [Penicillium brevicompactum]